MPLADGKIFAGYTILRRLGSGGMGEVYLAQHPRLPRRDALQLLPTEVSADREYRERFNREADMAATLWHPHIVGVHDRGESEGQLWIWIDYVDGTDAARLLAERQRDEMPPQEVLDIVTAVAQALDYAHQRDLLHRDVKPANILLAHPESGEQRITATSPTDEPLPPAQESPIRVCMQQTGQDRRQCREDIRRANEAGVPMP
ncbi:MAG: protein kinase family protein [Mycobacterium sp.]|nr:protein kinase family protein [Mycobacterium sp.]